MQNGHYFALSPSAESSRAQALDEADVWTNPLLEVGHGMSLPPTPESEASKPESEQRRTVSTAFNADAGPNPEYPADIQLVSSDDVYFYVSTAVLNACTDNRFTDALSGPAVPSRGFPCKRVPERADVLNILLHVAYGISPSAFAPSLNTLTDAIGRLSTYGLDPRTYVAPNRPLFELVRAQAALAPLHVYSVAASHDLFPLAQAVSQHLLSYPLSTMTDAQAAAIGALYLKHLFALQHRRMSTLRELLEQPPQFHPATEGCDYGAQRSIARAWSAAAATVVSEGRPDTSVSAIEDTFRSLRAGLTCTECKKTLEIRVRKAVVEWTMTSTTI